VRGLAAAVMLGLALVVASGARSAQQPASRVIDRTLLCFALPSGFRQLNAIAGAARRDAQTPTRWSSLARAFLTTGHRFGADEGLVGIQAGAPKPEPRFRTFTISRKLCTPTRARVPLSARGLEGGQADDYERFECPAPRRFLVRVRATFSRATFLRADPGQQELWTGVPVKEGSLAARTLTGEPLVFATARESGRAQLFTGASCIRDNT
jgi:hypothetical protein